MKAKKLDKSSENRILIAARNNFRSKGYDGTKMQEIADEAGINKAMLHYYYRNKDKLFEAVFKEAAGQFLPKIFELLNSDLPLFEKIEYFADRYTELLIQDPDIPAFIINAIDQNPNDLLRMFSDKGIFRPYVFISQVEQAVKNNEIIPIDPRQLILNLLGMCIFPVLARGPFKVVLSLSDEGYIEFMRSRKKEIPAFIISAIKIK